MQICLIPELLELMLCNGVDFTVSRLYSDSPLMRAVQQGSVAVVDLFVRYGMPVNGCSSQPQTPLFAAVIAGHVQMVRYLVESGVNVNQESALYSVSGIEFL
jgi:ankyrin repeat protein